MKTHNFTLVNLDTDSVSFAKPDGSSFSEAEQTTLLEELNSHYPDKISWEHDGIYDAIVVLKAKNYILKTYVCGECKKKGLNICQHEAAKITKKGSSLKSSKIEPRLKDFMDEIINTLLDSRPQDIIKVYNKYVREVHNLTDIKGWASKKTVTASVLNPTRTNEQKVLDAIGDTNVSMGDKIYVYFAEVNDSVEEPKYRKDKASGQQILVGYTTKTVTYNPLLMVKDWDVAKPDHSISTLIKKLYNTLVIFQNVIDIASIPKYHLKGGKIKLEEMLND